MGVVASAGRNVVRRTQGAGRLEIAEDGQMDRYAKYATAHLTVAAARIERFSRDGNDDGENSVTFLSRQKTERV